MKTKAELIHDVYMENNISKATTEVIINSFLNQVRNSLIQGNEVRLPEIGTFKFTTRKAHTGRKPKTGEPIEVPERISVRFVGNRALTRDLQDE